MTFFWIVPISRLIFSSKLITPIISSPNQTISAIVMSTEPLGAHPLHKGINVPVCMNNDVEIVVCQQAPVFWTNSLVIWLNLVGTTPGIALTRQLHRFGPLVKSTIFIAIRCIVVITITFNFRIIRLFLCSIDHFPNVQVFCHYRYRSGLAILIFPVNCKIIIHTSIAFICKFFISTGKKTIRRKNLLMIVGFILTATRSN